MAWHQFLSVVRGREVHDSAENVALTVNGAQVPTEHWARIGMLTPLWNSVAAFTLDALYQFLLDFFISLSRALHHGVEIIWHVNFLLRSEFLTNRC